MLDPSSRLCPLQQVRYLKIIEKSGYQALPWVRYITQNGGKVTTRRMVVHSAPMRSNWATVGQCSAIWWERALFWCSSMKKGIQCRTWGNVARSCEMHESLDSLSLAFFFFGFTHCASPTSNDEKTHVAHVDLFADVSSNCPASSPPPFPFAPFILGISCLHTCTSLSNSLLFFFFFFLHLIKIYPFPPQIISSGRSKSQPSAGRWQPAEALWSR